MYAPSIRFSPTNCRTDFFSPSVLSSSRNFFILRDINRHHLPWHSRGTSDPRGQEVFHCVISSDLLPCNDPDTSFAPYSLALSCSWEVLQDLGSNHLPILLSIPLSPSFVPTSVPQFSIFKKLAGMALPSAFTPTVLLQKNTRLFLFPLLLLSLPLWH